MNAFSFIIGLGASLGMAALALQNDRARDRHQLMDAGLLVLLGALLGGRVFFVAENWGYFSPHLAEAAQVWLGGFSGSGALAGGVVTLLPGSLLAHRSPVRLADGLLPLVPPLAISAWLACWQAGVAYGAAAPGGSAWWAFPARDEWGAVANRVPTQLLAATLLLALFTVLEQLKPRLSRPGQAGCTGIAIAALVALAFSFFRADPALAWRGWRLDGWAALGTFAGSILLCAIVFFPRLPTLRLRNHRQAPGNETREKTYS